MNHRVANEIVVSAKNVSKKFCKNLKRSMAYGIAELSKNLVGLKPDSTALRRDEFWALNNVSFELRRGEVLGIIGENGSGKTTLLRMLAGIFPPDKGRIVMKGRVGALIALGAGFHPHMTGRENIYLNGTILGMNRNEIDRKIDKIIDFAEITEFIDAPVVTYSSGMRVRLGFSVASQLNPDVLLIDEVLAVGDIGFRIKCLNAIANMVENTAVIFVSHTMQQISYISSKVMVLGAGAIEYFDNDVGRGIDYYNSRFKNAGQNVSGSGKAAVSNIKISNGPTSARGGEILKIGNGDDLSIEMDLSLDFSVGRVAMNVWLESRDMRPVADCYSQYCGFDIQPRKVSKIKLKLKNLCLNMGIYTINIGVFDLATKESLGRYANIATLQAQTLYTTWAPFALVGDWAQE